MSKKISVPHTEPETRKTVWEEMSKHDWRERTRGVRATRQKLVATTRPAPRQYRRAEPNMDKPGRKGRKAKARAVRVLMRYFGENWKSRL